MKNATIAQIVNFVKIAMNENQTKELDMAGMEQIFGRYQNLFMDLKDYYENFCTI